MKTTEESTVLTLNKPRAGDAPPTGEELRTGEQLRAITDPRERLAAAGEVAERATELADAWRTRRNAAGLQLYAAALAAIQRRGKVRGGGVEVWRDTLDISRSLWTRVLKDQETGKIKAGRFRDPDAVAREAAEHTERLDALIKEAQEVRNETARWLMNAVDGPRLRNAEVARLARVTTARIAQLRTSY